MSLRVIEGKATLLPFPVVREARVPRTRGKLSPKKRLSLAVRLGSCALNAIRWGREEEAYWQARFAARFARPLLLHSWRGWAVELGGEG